MPVYARDILRGDSSMMGFLMGALGAGALVGAIYLASRKNACGLIKVISRSGMIFSSGIILLSFTDNLFLSLPVMIIIGFGMITQLASCNIVLQTVVTDGMRGRIMGLFTIAMLGTMPAGSLLAGSLAGMITAPLTLLSGGICSAVSAAIFLTKESSFTGMMLTICNENKIWIDPSRRAIEEMKLSIEE
jgi:MFS family permease